MEESSLRDNPGGGTWPGPRVFEEHAGRFWGIVDTREYMRARYSFVDTMLVTFPRHRVAVETAVDHCMDMLRLNRSDNMGLRNFVPALMLRLGRDQDAYDFVRWWATCDPDGDYDWGNVNLPHLDTKDADALEDPRWWAGGRCLDLSHASVVVLIKLRLLFTLRDLQNTARALHGSILPREIVDQVRGELLVGSPLLAARRGLASSDISTLTVTIETVKKQIRVLFAAVGNINAKFWMVMALMHHDFLVPSMPDEYSLGSREEAEMMAIYNFDAWKETPGALDEIGRM
jgi:hypothetical protein